MNLVRDRANPHDCNAIKVMTNGRHVGFIPRPENAWFAGYMDTGGYFDAEIQRVIGGTPENLYVGLVIAVYFPDDVEMEFDT